MIIKIDQNEYEIDSFEYSISGKGKTRFFTVEIKLNSDKLLEFIRKRVRIEFATIIFRNAKLETMVYEQKGSRHHYTLFYRGK